MTKCVFSQKNLLLKLGMHKLKHPSSSYVKVVKISFRSGEVLLKTRRSADCFICVSGGYLLRTLRHLDLAN